MKQNHESYFLYGHHAVEAALKNPKRKIFHALITTTNLPKYQKLFSERKISFKIVDGRSLSKIIGFDSVHQGIALDVGKLHQLSLNEYLYKTDKLTKDVVILLDQVSDPHNVGAVIRNIAAFSEGALIMTKDNAPAESGSIAKSSAGTIEMVPLIYVTNLARSIEILQEHDYMCIGLDNSPEAEDISNLAPYKKIAFILGSESKGLRQLTKKQCNFCTKISINPAVDSLNISNASAIVLYKYSLL